MQANANFQLRAKKSPVLCPFSDWQLPEIVTNYPVVLGLQVSTRLMQIIRSVDSLEPRIHANNLECKGLTICLFS